MTYEDYKTAYKQLYEQVVEKYGVTDTVEKPLTALQWEANYKAATHTLSIELKEGKIKEMPNIAKYIVDRQINYLTDKQAKVLYNVAQNTGQNLTYEQIKYTGQIDWRVVNARREELRAQGYTSKNIETIVTNEFFYLPNK